MSSVGKILRLTVRLFRRFASRNDGTSSMINFISIIMLLAVFSVLPAPAFAGADASMRADAKEQAKRRIERERQFFYRTVEDLNRSQGYVQETIRGLEKQIDAVDILEPVKREGDIRSFLEWYRSYSEWLGNNLADIEADLSRSYSHEQGEAVDPGRYYSLAGGYSRLNSQLEEGIAGLEKLNDAALQRIAVLRSALAYIASSAFIEERAREKEREKKQERPARDRPKDEMFERYKDITNSEIAVMQLDLRNLGELQKHYVVLLEMGKMELFWISRKTADCEALAGLARVVGRDAPEAVNEAFGRMIALYDSDIAYFKKKLDDISRAKARLAPTGSLRALDRMEELSDNYDRMRSRFERHMSWLAEQEGAYRADIIVAGKGK